MTTVKTAELRQKIKELKEDLRTMKGAYFALHGDLKKEVEITALKARLSAAMRVITVAAEN